MFSVSQALCKCRVTLVSAAALALLPSCTVQSPAHILNSTGGASGVREIAFVQSEEESALRKSFRDRLKIAFQDQSVEYGPESSIIGDFGISTLPADVELASTQVAEGSSEEAIVTQSAARKSKPLDGCDAVRFRASLILYDKNSGNRIHRAEGEATGCENNEPPLLELASVLVKNALASSR